MTPSAMRTARHAGQAAGLALSLVLAAGLTVSAAKPASAATNYILCGGSPGGLWSLLGAGLDAVVKEVDPSATVTYQTSSGGFANIVQVSQGKCDMAIVHVGEAVMAQRGDAPFDAPVDDFRTLAVLYDWAPMQWLVTKDFADKHDLTSIADLKSAEAPIDLIVNRRGILPSILAQEALKRAGITFDDIDGWGGAVQYHGSRTAAGVMKDRKADGWVNAMFIGTGAITDTAESIDLTLLSVPEDVVSAMSEAYGSLPVVIPADAYPWLEEDVATFGARAALVVSETMDEETVRALTAAMISHIDKLQDVHASMKALNVEVMRSADELPYHPGATAAYDAAAS
ncbi:MAG: TAXI family TRAP transporter solute-binding subunit [Devosia sp.]